MRTKIYALLDPRQPSRIRYIGKTIHLLYKRLSTHISEAKSRGNCHRTRWIRKLLSEGARPVCELLDVVSGDGSSEERQAIAFCRLMGCRLTNNTDGGEGISGFRFSEESRAKISAAAKARMSNPEIRARIAASVKKAWKDPEKCARMMRRKPSSQRF